jgi:hypothetical protein
MEEKQVNAAGKERQKEAREEWREGVRSQGSGARRAGSDQWSVNSVQDADINEQKNCLFPFTGTIKLCYNPDR